MGEIEAGRASLDDEATPVRHADGERPESVIACAMTKGARQGGVNAA
jgi:hypothetical protein